MADWNYSNEANSDREEYLRRVSDAVVDLSGGRKSLEQIKAEAEQQRAQQEAARRAQESASQRSRDSSDRTPDAEPLVEQRETEVPREVPYEVEPEIRAEDKSIQPPQRVAVPGHAAPQAARSGGQDAQGGLGGNQPEQQPAQTPEEQQRQLNELTQQEAIRASHQRQQSGGEREPDLER